MKLSLSDGEIEDIKTEILQGRPYAERISWGFALRLMAYKNSFSVTDELDYLEGYREGTLTKPAAQFKPPLYPFWHKHFTTPGHLAHNLQVRWGMNKGGNRDLENLIKDIAQGYGGNDGEWPNYLADRLIIGGYGDRLGRGLTGNWIIYAQHLGLNYYLDLATHDEAVGDNAVKLLSKLQNSAYAEFPFCFEQNTN